ncbi:hypothetical protein VKT23_017691 [Stygiomarasmius scandens]|uniref:Uncharacterized protein n=1 Tax=Marasmiellus scandens TaxID=2682957 RepID=A0ABR1IUD7_9AGAR
MYWKGQGLTFNNYGDFYGTVRKISFVHPLFKHLRPSRYKSVQHYYHDSHNPWSTKAWPMRTSKAREELHDIIDAKSHYIVRLPLQLDHSLLTGPDAYERELPGKKVIIRFTLTHTVDDARKIDNFEGTIVSMEPVYTWVRNKSTRRI